MPLFGACKPLIIPGIFTRTRKGTQFFKTEDISFEKNRNYKKTPKHHDVTLLLPAMHSEVRK